MSLEVEGAPLIVSAVALAGLIAKPLWPYAVQLLGTRGKVTIDDRRRTDDRREKDPVPYPTSFTKSEHDSFCEMRLDTIKMRLTSIEAHNVDQKDATKEVKASVAKVSDRLDVVVDKMHEHHTEILTAINEIGRK